MMRIEAPKMFVDEVSTRILLIALSRPRTVTEISKRCGIPIASCYNRVKVLERKGLLKCVNKVTAINGREVSIYQSMLSNAYLFMDEGVLKSRFELVDCEQEDFTVDPGLQV